MAVKLDNSTGESEYQAPPEEALPMEAWVPLDEFCVAYGEQVEVETMGAFRIMEKIAGRTNDSVSNYLARLEHFGRQQAG